jgi:hypothetical protein
MALASDVTVRKNDLPPDCVGLDNITAIPRLIFDEIEGGKF